MKADQLVNLTIALTALVSAFGIVGCASIEQSAVTITSLLPAGTATERASTLLVDASIDVFTFDGRFTGWTTGPDIVNPNSGRQARALLISPGPHAITLTPSNNGPRIAGAGEWLLTHRFESGRKYRVIAIPTATTVSARLEVKDANGQWTLIKSILIDTQMKTGAAAFHSMR